MITKEDLLKAQARYIQTGRIEDKEAFTKLFKTWRLEVFPFLAEPTLFITQDGKEFDNFADVLDHLRKR